MFSRRQIAGLSVAATLLLGGGAVAVEGPGTVIQGVQARAKDFMAHLADNQQKPPFVKK